VAAFIDERAMRAPYLRDVPAEFVAWALPRWRADRTVPAFIPDLARHELLRFDIKNSPRGGEPATGRPIDLERPIRVDGSSVVMRYRWAVHALPAARSDRSEPDLRDSCIVAFRGRDQKTHTIDCKPWVAALVERLIAGDTLRVALFGALAACEMPLDDDILARTAIVLADFLDQELLLGAE
jgi:hypothetical protein